MSIILSHTTARAFHRAPERPDALESFPPRRKAIGAAPVDLALAGDARLKLVRYGVPDAALARLDVMVAGAADRRRSPAVACHVCAAELPAGSLLRLGGGVFVADVRLTALQAAVDLDLLELVEYYFELCGGYELPFDDEDDYRERPAPTSVAELRRFFEACSRCAGSAKALRALRFVRDGSRSPMETAAVMTLVLPKRMGGLGIRGLKMDHRVPVTAHARRLTRRACLYCDAFLPASRTDIEYHGFFHDGEERAAEDEERKNALVAMGFEVIALRRWAFFDGRAFERFTAAVCRAARISACRLPKGFERDRERLRRFVLRRWLEP